MISRRSFIATTGSAALLLPSVLRASLQDNPFTLGVASGSPRENSVVLWTRLAPEPLRGGGMPGGDVRVNFRVWADPELRRVVQEGTTLALEQFGHSVHLKIEGLEPGREYWYQFMLNDFHTVVGRTRTSRPSDATSRLAVASCQAFQSGFYAAYADMAEWAPDCVVHVGDYIYEGAASPLGATVSERGGEKLTFHVVRQHNGGEAVTLWDYRNRYALYRSDPSLQAAHAVSPWIVAMDDHEIDNNWASDTPQDPWSQTALEFKVRKLAALQAYYEHMPLEAPPVVQGLDSVLRMYGDYRFGPSQVHLLDTRQSRADQACGDGRKPLTCEELRDPTRSMLGREQERWLLRSLAASEARYNVIASQVWFAPLVYGADGDSPLVNMDSWDGYPLARQRIVDQLATSAVSNPIFISGDWHCAAAMRVHAEPMNAASRPVAHEFAGTSIASNCPWAGEVEKAEDHNRHLRYVNGRQRGYARFIADGRDWTTAYRVVEDPLDPASRVTTDREIRISEF